MVYSEYQLSFNEWGRAVWQLQHDFMKQGTGHDWRFVSYVSEYDGNLDFQKQYMANLIQQAQG